MRHLSPSLDSCQGLLRPGASRDARVCSTCGRVFLVRGDVLIAAKPDRRHDVRFASPVAASLRGGVRHRRQLPAAG